jgi:hypothetical protein
MAGYLAAVFGTGNDRPIRASSLWKNRCRHNNRRLVLVRDCRRAPYAPIEDHIECQFKVGLVVHADTGAEALVAPAEDRAHRDSKCQEANERDASDH